MMRLTEVLVDRAWMPVRAADVVAGDVYANHGTVTASRKTKPGESQWQWAIIVGRSMSMFCSPDEVVIVGRAREPQVEVNVVANAIGFAMFSKPGESKVKVAPEDSARCKAAAVRVLDQLAHHRLGSPA